MREYWVPILYTINLGSKTNIGSNTNNIGFPFSILLVLGLRLILGPILIILSPHFLDMGFPCGSAGEESACNAGDLGSIPGLGRSPGEGKGYPLQYSGLENSKDSIVHEVTNSQTQLSDFRFTSLPQKHSARG